jgi:hypothetical protein
MHGCAAEWNLSIAKHTEALPVRETDAEQQLRVRDRAKIEAVDFHTLLEYRSLGQKRDIFGLVAK